VLRLFAFDKIAAMDPERGIRRIWLRLATIVALIALVAAAAAQMLHRRNRPISIFGAVIQKNDDPNKQTPVTGVDVTLEGTGPTPTATSSVAGSFKLTLPLGMKRGQPITLLFRQARYEPLELKTNVADQLYVVQLTPLRSDDQPPPSHPDVPVTNVLVRYSIESSAEVNVGTAVKTFQVINAGDVPCQGHPPCSPDGKWKATAGSASLDAGAGNVFRNARVSCIAGPCPFTKIVSDDFPQGDRYITASALNWSDTTTFLFEAEVLRMQVSDIVRQSYPVIFGQTLNFSLPASAEGPSLQAEIGGEPITFPLGPNPVMSWAVCSIIVAKDRSRSYRCELSRGFTF
jgi:hypothetical protein